MSARLKLVLVAALTVFSFAAFTGSASAQLFCIHVTTCSYGGQTGTNDEYAFSDIGFYATTNDPGTDVLLLGDTGGPIVGSLAFGDTSQILKIVAEPGSSPVVQPDSGAYTTITLNGAVGSDISGIEIQAPDKANSQALLWNRIASDLKITGTMDSVDARGVQASQNSDAQLLDSTIDVTTHNKGAGIYAVFAHSLVVRNTVVNSDALIGIDLLSSGLTATLDRVKVTAAGRAIQIAGTNTTVTANDVFAHSTNLTSLDGVVDLATGATANFDHATLVGTNENGSGMGVHGRANGGQLHANFKNSIVTRVPTGAYSEETGGGLAYIDFSNSMVRNKLGLNASITTNAVAYPVDGPAFLVGSGNDFRLLAPNTAIDAGDDSVNDPLDVDGNTRVVDGDSTLGAHSDLGAFEYQHRAPVIALKGDSALIPGQPGEFDANGTADPDDEGFTYSWDFGDGSPPVTSSLKVHHAYAAGHFELSFTATDDAGVSATSTLGIEVMATYVPPPVVTVDSSAPVITLNKFKLDKKGTKITTTLACPATETRCTFDLSLFSAGKKSGAVGKIKYAKAIAAIVGGGSSAKVTIKLNKAAIKLLKNSNLLKTSLQVRATDAAGNASTRTVQYTAKKGKTGSAK
jgi:hypothetical protein